MDSICEYYRGNQLAMQRHVRVHLDTAIINIRKTLGERVPRKQEQKA